MHLLVTGASGRIGRAFVGAVEPAYTVIRADLHDAAPDDRAGPSSPFLCLDVRDPVACRAACEGVDTVLHLAADPSPEADFATSVLPVNIAGTHAMITAAVGAGVARFVFASSAQAVAGYPLDHQVRELDAPRPANDYGVGKAFGEALCASAVGRGTTTFVSVRIGHYAVTAPDPERSLRDRMAWLSERDAMQLLGLALSVPIAGHEVVHGISDNRAKQLSIDRTRALLGYAPVDDAFAGPSTL